MGLSMYKGRKERTKEKRKERKGKEKKRKEKKRKEKKRKEKDEASHKLYGNTYFVLSQGIIYWAMPQLPHEAV
jgi:hypothetical protein